jgi:hypothetical protein
MAGEVAMPRAEERRRFSRIRFHRPAELDAHGERVSCELLDISLKGALFEIPATARAHVDEPATLTIRLDAGDATIRMSGRLVHREGVQVGLRCAEIDIDSIAHLRRLVELNLGDEALLERELSALISP